MTLEEYFSTGPEREQPIFDAVMQHMATVGPVHVEPVSVGIFLKRSRSFAELRPMQRWVALSFSLPEPSRTRGSPDGSSPITVGSSTWPTSATKTTSMTRSRGWLTEAYLNSPE